MSDAEDKLKELAAKIEELTAENLLLKKQLENVPRAPSDPITVEYSMGVAYGMPLYDDEQTEFDVILVSVPANRAPIEIIKYLRLRNKNLMMNEAFAAVKNLPYTVASGISKAESSGIKARLEELGAEVEVK